VPSAQCPIAEVISEVRIHGNLVATNDEILTLAGLTVGSPFTAATLADVAGRLSASKKFDDVQVLKRFASIEDASRITVVILVNEGPVRLTSSLTPVRRSRIRNVMFMPILDAEDGYGLTYGVRAAYVDALGPKSRLSFPLTWGGTKQAGADVERAIGAARRTRIKLGAALQRQENPAFLEEDTRRRLWGRVEHARGPFRAGGSIGWQDVSFAAIRDRFRSAGVDVAFDTRLDPVLPRNAVLATASWERVGFDRGSGQGAVTRTRIEGRGYLGLVGQTVLAVRAVRESSSGPLPAYLKPLLGGWSTLRGYKAGAFAGDMLVAESVELRVPLTSPLRVARLGVSIFADGGRVYEYGQRFGDQPFHRSAGASVWLAAPVFHLGVSVARGRGTDTRVNFGAGLTF
jgi:outer membrane protein assembly factor BamA